MQLSDFHYPLPNELIARYPLAVRTASRMLCLKGKTGQIIHNYFGDIIQKLYPGDLLVFNNTKVIPARLYGHKKTGGKIEILIERIRSDNEVLAMIRASKSPKPGSEIIISGGNRLIVKERRDDFFILQFQFNEVDHNNNKNNNNNKNKFNDNKSHKNSGEINIINFLNQYGEMPLPPYIDREVESEDSDRYQTVYAKHEGAVAAPTAGLHFDNALIKEIEEFGIETAYLTLHVGAGTFQPVRVDDIKQHKMHKEYIDVSEALCHRIRKTKTKGGRVIAVGTTTVRSLETAAHLGEIAPFQGDTDIFIYPGFKFNCVDAMITNFHLPGSTLLMLVSAFAGFENIMAAYREAIRNEYRFYSYGDAMFIEAGLNNGLNKKSDC